MTSAARGGRPTAYSPLFVQKRDRGHQLPALDIPSSSLTEGTNIPPPKDSPLAHQQEAASIVPLKGPLGSTDSPQPRPGTGSGSTPQTPLPLESPNPLRSHPTSNHSLSRQFQDDADQALPGVGQGPFDGIGVTHTTTITATHYNGHAQAPSTTTGSTKRPAGSDISAAPSGTQPSKRQPASDSISPPSKRPMSVRKFLGLRALSAAFTGRSSAEKERETSGGSGDGKGVYTHHRNRSSEMLSLFTRRPESRQSNNQPSLRKRRSSLMLLGRRGSSFFGLNVDEKPEAEAQQGRSEPEHPYHQQPSHGSRGAQPGGRQASQDVHMEDTRSLTPPPMLPGLDNLKASRGLHEQDGAFMNGEDMFRNIQ